MQYTFKIEDWETTVSIETDDVNVLEKLSEAVLNALADDEDEEEEDAE
jgi:hypothetical protein